MAISDATAAVTVLSSELERLTTVSRDAAESVQQDNALIRESAVATTVLLEREGQRQANALEVMRAQIGAFENDGAGFRQELQLLSDAVLAGARDSGELLAQLKHTGAETLALREKLADANLPGLGQEMQVLAAQIQSGAAGITETLELLDRRGGVFSERIAEWVKLLGDGNLSGERFLELIQDLLTTAGSAPGSNLQALAESLAGAAQAGAFAGSAGGL